MVWKYEDEIIKINEGQKTNLSFNLICCTGEIVRNDPQILCQPLPSAIIMTKALTSALLGKLQPHRQDGVAA